MSCSASTSVARKRFPDSGPGSATGFTLIEVIVALAILSLIMLATVSALRTFANTQGSLDELTGRIDEVRTISSFLRDSLDSTVFEADSGGLALGGYGGGEMAYFAGTPASLEWKSPVLFGEGFGGTFLLQLAHEDEALLLRWKEPVAAGEPIKWAGAQSRVLISNVDEFEVMFLSEFGAQWKDHWVQPKSPALVRMTIKSGGRYWPELIMQVQR